MNNHLVAIKKITFLEEILQETDSLRQNLENFRILLKRHENILITVCVGYNA